MGRSPGCSPSSRIKQRQSDGLTSLTPSGNVLRYRVRDGSELPSPGELHSARRRHGDGMLSGRVLAIDMLPQPLGSAASGSATFSPEGEVDGREADADAPSVPVPAQVSASGELGPTPAREATVTVLIEPEMRKPAPASAVVAKMAAAAKNPSTGWKPRPPPAETEGHRMVRRRLREDEERSTSPTPLPQREVDMSGWEPGDGNAKPIIDAYLRYAPTKGRSAMGEMKVLEKLEDKLRATTKRRMDHIKHEIKRIVESWDELLAEGSKKVPRGAVALVESLEKNTGLRSGHVEDLGKWYRDNAVITIGDDPDQDGEQTEMHLAATITEAKDVAEGADTELVRENNRVGKLREMMSDLAAQLSAVKKSVGELNAELKTLRTHGLEALHEYNQKNKKFEESIKIQKHETVKAEEKLRVELQTIENLKEGIATLAGVRKERGEAHDIEMERLRKLLERMREKHTKDLDRMQQLHLDRIEEMRAAIKALVARGVSGEKIDEAALRIQAREHVEKQGYEGIKSDLWKHLEDLKNQHAKLEQDFMMHSAEEQDLIAQRDLALVRFHAF